MMSYYNGNGFSYDGLSILFDYLEEFEAAVGVELVFDPVAVHCQYSEMAVQDFIQSYLPDDYIKELKKYLNVENIQHISSYDLYDYMYNHSDYYDYLVDVVDDKTLLIDTERH